MKRFFNDICASLNISESLTVFDYSKTHSNSRRQWAPAGKVHNSKLSETFKLLYIRHFTFLLQLDLSCFAGFKDFETYFPQHNLNFMVLSLSVYMTTSDFPA